MMIFEFNEHQEEPLEFNRSPLTPLTMSQHPSYYQVQDNSYLSAPHGQLYQEESENCSNLGFSQMNITNNMDITNNESQRNRDIEQMQVESKSITDSNVESQQDDNILQQTPQITVAAPKMTTSMFTIDEVEDEDLVGSLIESDVEKSEII